MSKPMCDIYPWTRKTPKTLHKWWYLFPFDDLIQLKLTHFVSVLEQKGFICEKSERVTCKNFQYISRFLVLNCVSFPRCKFDVKDSIRLFDLSLIFFNWFFFRGFLVFCRSDVPLIFYVGIYCECSISVSFNFNFGQRLLDFSFVKKLILYTLRLRRNESSFICPNLQYL